MAPRVIELTACPGCGGQDLAPEEVGGGAVLRRCRSCGTVSAPEYADPGDVYVDGYFRGQTGFGIDVSAPGFRRFLASISRRRLEIIERRAGGRGSLLDVGCGDGRLLLAARDRGWRVQGVDPLADASVEAREEHGLDVRTAMLQESGLPERSYDVVCALHVVEHMPDAPGFLRTLARWARPGGHVVVEVPNYDSAQRRHTQSQWPSLRPLEHLSHFTPATLRGVMQRAGLRPMWVRSLTYLGPPQDLDQALWDLGKSHWRRALAPLCARDEATARLVPRRAGWAALRAMRAVSQLRGHGLVVMAVARVD